MAAPASLCPNPPFSSTSSSSSATKNPPFTTTHALFFRSSNKINLLKSANYRISNNKAVVFRCSLNSGNGSVGVPRPDYVPNRISDPSYVRVFDTTLRDGEQSPGATMTTKQKLDIARQLSRLGVDIIEAGFPASSEADLEAVQLIAKEIGNSDNPDVHVPVICGLARCNKRDIDKAWEAVQWA